MYTCIIYTILFYTINKSHGLYAHPYTITLTQYHGILATGVSVHPLGLFHPFNHLL